MIILSLNFNSFIPNINLNCVSLQISEYNLNIFWNLEALQICNHWYTRPYRRFFLALFLLTPVGEHFLSPLKRQGYICVGFHLLIPVYFSPWGIPLHSECQLQLFHLTLSSTSSQMGTHFSLLLRFSACHSSTFYMRIIRCLTAYLPNQTLWEWSWEFMFSQAS